MPEGYRLCALKMGIARHDSTLVLLRLVGNGRRKLCRERYKLAYPLAQIKAYVECDLIVSAACGMQLLSRSADA